MSKNLLLGIVFPASVVLAGVGMYVACRLSPHKPAPIRSLWGYAIRVYGFYRDDVSDADRRSSIKQERDVIIAGAVIFVVSLFSLGYLAHFFGLVEQ